MIYRVWSSLNSFKAMSFRPGLSVVLADRTAISSDQQTRNRAGKSSLVEIIHFLTGANVDQRSLFRKEALQGVTFGMEMDVAGSTLGVERSTSTLGHVEVTGLGDDGQAQGLSVDEWKQHLGRAWFGLTGAPGEPSMRQLFGYFARREATGGFLSPLKYFPQQPRGNQEAWLMYLLGLDWEIAAELQRICEEDATLNCLLISRELRARAARADGRLEELRRAASEFRAPSTIRRP